MLFRGIIDIYFSLGTRSWRTESGDEVVEKHIQASFSLSSINHRVSSIHCANVFISSHTSLVFSACLCSTSPYSLYHRRLSKNSLVCPTHWSEVNETNFTCFLPVTRRMVWQISSIVNRSAVIGTIVCCPHRSGWAKHWATTRPVSRTS